MNFPLLFPFVLLWIGQTYLDLPGPHATDGTTTGESLHVEELGHLSLGYVDLAGNLATMQGGVSYAGSMAWDPRMTFRNWRIRGTTGISLYKSLANIYPALDLGVSGELALNSSHSLWLGAGYHGSLASQSEAIPGIALGPGLSLSYEPRFERNNLLARVDRIFAEVVRYNVGTGLWFVEYGLTFRLGQ